MTESTTISTQPPPGSRYASWLLALFGVMWIFLAVFFFIKPGAAMFGAYLLTTTLLVAVFLAVKLAQAGTKPLPLPLFLAGLTFIIGGAVADLVATIIHSPDLSREDNYVVRALLANSQSVFFVYCFGFVAQSALMALFMFLWAALLRHRGSIIESIRIGGTCWQRVKIATRGSYHLLWIITVILLASSVDRWFLALAWNGLDVEYRSNVALIGIAVGLGVYALWQFRAARSASK